MESSKCAPIGTPPAKLPLLIQQRRDLARNNVDAPQKQSRIPTLINFPKITRSQSVRDKPSSTFSITEMVETLSFNNTRNTAAKEVARQIVTDGSSTTETTSTVNKASGSDRTDSEIATTSSISSSNPLLVNQRIQRAATFKLPASSNNAAASDADASDAITSSIANKKFDNVKTLHRGPTSTLKRTISSLREKYQGISPIEESETKKTDFDYDRVLVKLDREIRQRIEKFPNVMFQQSRGASYTASWSWLRSYKSTKDSVVAEPNAYERFKIMNEYFERVKTTESLLDRIRYDFAHGPQKYETQASKDAVDQVCRDMLICKVGTRGVNFISDGIISYMRDTFKHEVQKQARYQKWMCKHLTDPADARKRNKLVEWVVETAKTLEYPSETTHLAVHYIDAYLRIKGNKISNCAWTLLGITALYIAGKMEEVDPAKIPLLVRMSGKFYKIDEVKWMEKQILEKLQFDIYPPLAPVFVRLILLGGSLEFPTLNLRKLTMDLSMGILHRSLLNHKLYSVPPMDKAKAALDIAVEFIFYQYHVCNRRDMSVYSFLNSEPGLALGEFALGICSETFTNRFTNRILSNVVPAVTCMASPVRDIKA